jgi:ribosomal protein S18 acetylase RimI-like enzyme
MQVKLIGDPGLFTEVAGVFLRSDPFSTNVIGAYLAATAAGLRPSAGADLWAAVIDHGAVAGVAMRAAARHLFLSRMPSAAACQLAITLQRSGQPVPGVNGEVSAVTAFTDTWTARTGTTASVELSMRMYRLGELAVPARVPGAARVAGAADAAVARDWFLAFHAEAIPHQPAGDLAGEARHRLDAGQIFLWTQDGRPVSLAAHSTPASRVARIGPVYTPARQRRHGYGAAVTARATKAAIKAGAEHVVLYTDLANLASNAIYQSIGYVADHDARDCLFHEPGRPGRPARQ